MKLLELRHVHKSYQLAGGELYPALKDINVSFQKGELVSIIGESGSGKSTLMNVIGGLDSDFTGELLFNEQNIGNFTEKQLDEYRKNKIGFIFQSFNLIPHLSVLDNVTIAMTLSNVGKEERVKRAEEILEQVGLKKHIHKKPNQLSGGQKQRVAIARALINDPEIIIADEPTGALDSETTEQVLQIIEEIAKRGKLVIMVTHSEKVAQHSSRIIEIADGQIISDHKGRTIEHIDAGQAATVQKEKQNLSFGAAVKLAFQNMKEKLNRNIWVSLGASIGIMSVILMLSLGNGVKDYMNASMNSMVNPLVVEVNMNNDDADTGSDSESNIQDPQMMMMSMLGEKAPFAEEDIEKLSNIEHVTSVEKGINLISVGSNTISFGDKESLVMMVSTVSSNLAESSLLEGSFPEENEILISEGTAKQFGDDIIGETVKLKVVVGEEVYTSNFIVSGITEQTAATQGMETAYIQYDDLKQIYEDNGNELEPNSIYLLTDDEEYTDGIREEIKDLGYNGSTQETATALFSEMLDVVTYVLAGISGVSLFVSAIMILVVLHISVVERTKEIGVLKAIGARRKDIKRIFVSEAFLIGLSSGLIGVTITSLLSAIANMVSRNLLDINIVQMNFGYVVFGITASIVISMLAGLMPAGKAAKLDPVDSLRRD
ncbi:MAG: ATP-binding cassette domain-containing protein [Bacillus sp. (in: firmicutes)]